MVFLLYPSGPADRGPGASHHPLQLQHDAQDRQRHSDPAPGRGSKQPLLFSSFAVKSLQVMQPIAGFPQESGGVIYMGWWGWTVEMSDRRAERAGVSREAVVGLWMSSPLGSTRSARSQKGAQGALPAPGVLCCSCLALGMLSVCPRKEPSRVGASFTTVCPLYRASRVL